MDKFSLKISESIKPQNLTHLFIFGLIFVSLTINLWGFWNASNVDEYNEVVEALRVGSGHLNFDRWGKRVFLYILGVEYGIYFVLGWIVGAFSSVSDFAVKIARDMEPLFYIARVTSALFAAGTVWFTYKIGKRVYSIKVGLIAATFVVFTPIFIEFAHYGKVDTCFAFLMSCSMYFIIGIHQDKNWFLRDHILAALFAGLAFQCKAPGIMLLVPFAITYFYRWQRERPLAWSLVLKIMTTSAASFVLGMILGNPVIILDFPGFLNSFIGLGYNVYVTKVHPFPVGDIGFVVYAIGFYEQLGLLLFSIILIAALYVLIIVRRQEYILLFSLLVSLYVTFGASRYQVNFAYMIPLLPFLYIILGTFLDDLLKRILLKEKIRNLALLLFCLVLLYHPFVGAAILVKSFSGSNLRIVAKQWIEENIPAHSKILMDSGKFFNTSAPTIAEDSDSLNRLMGNASLRVESDEYRDSRGLIRPESMIFYELLLQTVPEISYDITSTGQGIYVKDLNYYRNNGFEYFIMNERIARKYLSEEGRKMYPKRAAFYETAKNELNLVKTIAPTSINRGSTYSIYSFD